MCLEKFCEKMCDIHRNPINCFLHLIAGIIIIYALWIHNVKLILIAILIFIIGHIIQAISSKKRKKKKR